MDLTQLPQDQATGDLHQRAQITLSASIQMHVSVEIRMSLLEPALKATMAFFVQIASADTEKQTSLSAKSVLIRQSCLFLSHVAF